MFSDLILESECYQSFTFLSSSFVVALFNRKINCSCSYVLFQQFYAEHKPFLMRLPRNLSMFLSDTVSLIVAALSTSSERVRVHYMYACATQSFFHMFNYVPDQVQSDADSQHARWLHQSDQRHNER